MTPPFTLLDGARNGDSTPRAAPGAIDGLFQGVVEATEEAVLNSLFRAATVVGRDGHTSIALPLDRVQELLRAGGVVPR